jgi:hypothetical protein
LKRIGTACVLIVSGLAIVFVGQRALASPSSQQHLGCAQRAETSAPTVFHDPRDRGRATTVLIGPVELHGAGGYRPLRVFSRLGKREGYYIAKVALIVQARRSIRFRVKGKSADSVLLEYADARTGSNELLIDSCAANTRARSRPGVVGSGTIFTGVFELTAAQCVNVVISDRAKERTWRRRLPFGHICPS